MDKEIFQREISNRFLQIRQSLYDGNNQKMASDMGVDRNSLSGMCNGSRNIGITDVLRLLETIPDVDANWLLMGRIPKSYSSKPEEEVFDMVAEDSTPYGIPEGTPPFFQTLLQKQQETISRMSKIIDKLSEK